MVSFSNMDGAHCDSVVDHYTLPSNSIQMDVKVPVQPSNFDPLQKGALMGASTFMEQDKNHSNQCNYKTKSIPSPGTTYSENPAYGWVFAFLRPASPSNYVRLFAAQRLTPSGPARQARCSTPAALVRVRAPLFKEPAQKAGFCFSTTGLSIELRSIIRRTAAHPFGASATSALFNACGVSPSPGTTI
ncbi:hypothetical protein [Klebsiella pasteurii]|nr:hypothetical protein [Klebsiella pasteurii]MDV1072859.1 hypothetical protein [Klebsiella pasteurii]MDV1078898.1 hypothetical protein [Klebsiella pasteurii]